MFWLLLGVFIVTYLLIDWLIRWPRLKNYHNKYVFITGCDSGFGHELAIRLDGMNFHVFTGCFTQEGRQILEEICSDRVCTIELDVTKNSSIQAALDIVKQKLPDESSLWGVVNNAGVSGVPAPSEMCTRDDFLSVFQINLFGPIEVCRLFAPLIRKSKGRFVTITSIAGRFAFANSSYCASKFGLEAYHDLLRREMGRFGVKVSMLEPGFFNTGIVNVERIMGQAEKAFGACDNEVQEAYGRELLSKLKEQLAHFKANLLSDKTYQVVDAYVDALTCKYPRCRYVVGYDAKFVFIPLSLVPEWMSDAFFKMTK